MVSSADAARVVLIGIGATALMDAWLLLLARAGLGGMNVAFIGRWVGHWSRGRFAHASIAKAAPVVAERALGWLTHYAVGIAYAGVLVAWQGPGWLRQPTPWPALALGVATVIVPLFVMQPAMGAGVAGTKTGAPWATCARSLANHIAFGAGLYASAALIDGMPPLS